MRKFILNTLIGIGVFFISYPIGVSIRKDFSVDNEKIAFLIIGLLILLLAYIGHYRNKKEKLLRTRRFLNLS